MPVHPSAVVPVTEYVVVEVGETVSVGLTPRELDQLNVVPIISELAVSSVLSPRQISFGVAVAVIVGNGAKLTKIVSKIGEHDG
jgi:hypothetical protein